ncbi:hypothetical protein HDV00_005088 [Rhizophlyctis rosea]|nr:hypothetical protein HDV00_005088 [Rhizophlyctis rosea]
MPVTDTSADADFANNEMFTKIRTQTSSGLENQKQAAVILMAVEETIREQNEALTPLAYFGALMTIMEQQREQAIHDEDKKGILVAVSYLLAIVFPRIPVNIQKLKFQDISKTLGATLEAHQEQAPLVRSIIACLEYLLTAQDNATWTSDITCKKLFQILLIMSVDPRPKVRRRAHEAVKRLLARPPSPTLHHPATLTSIDFSIKSLNEFAASASSASAKQRKEIEAQVLHVLVFLKTVLPVLAVQGGHDKTRGKLRELCDTLLKLPVRSSGMGNTVVTQWVFQVLDALFGAGAEEERQGKGGIFPHLDMALLDSVILALLEIRPYQNDVGLIPAWLDLIGRGFARLADLARIAEADVEELASPDRQYALNEYPELVTSVFSKTFVALLGQSATKPVIVEKGTELFMGMIQNCITPSMMEEVLGGMDDSEKKSHVEQMIDVVNGGLSQIRYRDAWGGILRIAEMLFERLGSSNSELVIHTLELVMAFRDDPAYGESFPYKEELEGALTAAVQAMGLGNFISHVPLNILGDVPKQPRRPYLLATFGQAMIRPIPEIPGTIPPIFGSHTLHFYGSELIPLAKKMFTKSAESWTANRQIEAKLYETLGLQIWDLFPGLCATLPEDVEMSFGGKDGVGMKLGQILQAQPAAVFPNLPSNPDLRPIICDGLQRLVDGYLEVAEGDDEEEEEEGEESEESMARQMAAMKAQRSVEKLKEYGNQFLTTLCNNYTTVDPSILNKTTAKGQALQGLHEKENQRYEPTIRSFLFIADGQAVNDFFINLVGTLLQSQTQQPDSADPTSQLVLLRSYAILDLLLILLPFLPEVTTPSDTPQPNSPLQTFYRVLTGQLRDTDTTMQKKTYKALSLVLPLLPPQTYDMSELVQRILDPEVLSKTSSGAKRQRMKVLQLIAETIDIGRDGGALLLEFVPVALSEVMLGTKEASEKARNASYECLVAMGRRMAGGVGGGATPGSGPFNMRGLQEGLLTSSSDSQMDDSPDRAPEVSLREYMMMVTAGLAGSTSSMQSAATASLGRLVFEFHDMMDEELLEELVGTVMYFMESRNREIIKAALGFVKVVVVCLRQEVLEGSLEQIVVSILTHSRDHKSHFKSKVRHIFERLVRKFSYEAIEGFVPEADRKLIVNIKKRRDRLKKQKAAARKEAMQGEEDSDGDEIKAGRGKKVEDAVRSARQKAFEDALHGSESELSSGDDDEGDDAYIPDSLREGSGSRKGKGGESTMIREDEEVVDFLDRNVVSRVTTSSGRRGKGRRAEEEFERDETGKWVFNEEGEGVEEEKEEGGEAMDTEDYYKQSLRSEAAIVRTPVGRVKFANKRKRDGDDDDDDDGNDDAGVGGAGGATGMGWKQGAMGKGKKGEKGLDESQVSKMLGKQYKAKRAKGDVKKAGMPDPYAYIPLNSKTVGGPKKKKQAGTFKSIVKAAQKGSEVGTAQRAKAQKSAAARKGNKRHK